MKRLLVRLHTERNSAVKSGRCLSGGLTRHPCTWRLKRTSGGEIEPLGLYAERAKNLALMSGEFLFGDWRDIRELPGVGQYAWDAVQIFCLGRTALAPEDRVLNAFLQAVR